MAIMIPSFPAILIHIDRAASCADSYPKKRAIRWTLNPFDPVLIDMIPPFNSLVNIRWYIFSIPGYVGIYPVSILIRIYVYVSVVPIPIGSMPLIIGLIPPDIPGIRIIFLKG